MNFENKLEKKLIWQFLTLFDNLHMWFLEQF